MNREHAPDPCTEDAREQGCTCTMEHSHSASIDPPEPITDKHCPLHGWAQDPDDALEERRDRERFEYDFPFTEEWD